MRKKTHLVKYTLLCVQSNSKIFLTALLCPSDSSECLMKSVYAIA